MLNLPRKGGVAILVKKGNIINQEWKNEHFNVITDNEALAIEIELQNGDRLILAAIYCQNENPNLLALRGNCSPGLKSESLEMTSF